MKKEHLLKICKFGFYSGIGAFLAVIAFDISQLLQYFGMLKFPLDEIFIYGFSLAIPIPYLLEILALHFIVSEDRKIWTLSAFAFAVIYVVFVTANYVVQLATVIPMRMRGDTTSIGILVQTPHSMFWDFDAIGYIFMGLSTLFAVPVFDKTGLQQWGRYSFFAHAMVTPMIAIVYFYPVFTPVLYLLGFPWGITAPAAILLLALFFRKGMKREVL